MQYPLILPLVKARLKLHHALASLGRRGCDDGQAQPLGLLTGLGQFIDAEASAKLRVMGVIEVLRLALDKGTVARAHQLFRGTGLGLTQVEGLAAIGVGPGAATGAKHHSGLGVAVLGGHYLERLRKVQALFGGGLVKQLSLDPAGGVHLDLPLALVVLAEGHDELAGKL